FGAVSVAISIAAARSVFFVSVEYRPNCAAWSESKFFKQSHCFPGDNDSAAVILCALAHIPRIQVSAKQDDFLRLLRTLDLSDNVCRLGVGQKFGFHFKPQRRPLTAIIHSLQQLRAFDRNRSGGNFRLLLVISHGASVRRL